MTAQRHRLSGPLRRARCRQGLGFEEETLARLSSWLPAGLSRSKDTAERQFHDSGIDLHQPLVQKFLSLYWRHSGPARAIWGNTPAEW